jgi:hypothetical protein
MADDTRVHTLRKLNFRVQNSSLETATGFDMRNNSDVLFIPTTVVSTLQSINVIHFSVNISVILQEVGR